MHVVLSRYDIWAAVDDLRERVETVFQDDGIQEAVGLAIGGLAMLEMLLRPAAEPEAAGMLFVPPENRGLLDHLQAARDEIVGLAAPAEPAKPTAPEAPAEPAKLVTVTVPATPKTGGDDDGPWLTTERRELLKRLWGDPAESLRTIKESINATAGRRVNNYTALYKLAELAGLPRKRADTGMIRGAAKVAVDNKPPTPDEEDMREAKTLVREGRDARFIAEEFGWTVDQAAKLVAEVREENQAAEGAAEGAAA